MICHELAWGNGIHHPSRNRRDGLCSDITGLNQWIYRATDDHGEFAEDSKSHSHAQTRIVTQTHKWKSV